MSETVNTKGRHKFQYSKEDEERIRSEDTDSTKEFKERLEKNRKENVKKERENCIEEITQLKSKENQLIKEIYLIQHKKEDISEEIKRSEQEQARKEKKMFHRLFGKKLDHSELIHKEESINEELKDLTNQLDSVRNKIETLNYKLKEIEHKADEIDKFYKMKRRN